MNPPAEIQKDPYGELGSLPARVAELEPLEGQATLTDSEAMLAGILHALGDYICIVDENLTIVWANKMATASFGPNLVGGNCYRAYHRRDRPCENCVAALVLQDGQTRHHEYHMPAHAGDGTERWFWCTASLAARHRDRRPKTVIVVSRDITEHKNAEERSLRLEVELAHAARVSTMGEMVVGIAHELNQPLTAVASRAAACALAIGSRNPEPAEILDDLAEIASQAERAGEIIRRFRFLTAKRQFKPSSLDVNEVVREVAGFLRHDIHMNRVALCLKLPPKIPPVLAVSVQIQQVLLNLMRNAIEAMSTVEDGERKLIVQTSMNSPEAVEVEVRDTGPGVEEGDLERLFEPFFTRKGEGLGVGLAICRTIMEVHGGRVWATRNPKRGTTFRFTLPLPESEPDDGNPTQGLCSR